MNKPVAPPVSDDEIPPLDEHGQQIWSPGEEVAIARLLSDPGYQADVAAGLASIARGDGYATDEMLLELARRRATR